jgi:hypothetical protein
MEEYHKSLIFNLRFHINFISRIDIHPVHSCRAPKSGVCMAAARPQGATSLPPTAASHPQGATSLPTTAAARPQGVKAIQKEFIIAL